ncbi:MAG: hypothetical protein DIU62_010910 [Pseudomonadota bacterium]|jgi:hypothetical protein|nr:MAG: hypothetical protein DIU62_15655 [Pseudomonadota bacterium]
MRSRLRTSVLRLIDLIGKAWNLPNTVLGLAYGALGYLVGRLTGTKPSVSIGNNAIQFHDSGLMRSAMTLGNVIIYGPTCPPGRRNCPFRDSPVEHTVGREEYRHTLQGQVLGPLYLPLHLLAGLISLLRSPYEGLREPVDAWHRHNFLEYGPMRDRTF